MKRNRTVAVIALVLSLLCIGYGALAAEAGSQGDPLVTLNYLVNIFRPQAVSAATSASQGAVSDYQAVIQGRLTQSQNTLTSTLTQVSTLVQSDSFAQRVAQAAGLTGAQQQAQQQSIWQSITLSAGESVTAPLGAQLVLRSGSASAIMALTDLTTGATLNSGGSLSANHLYLVPAQGACLEAVGAVTLLVRGGVSFG